MSYIDEAEKITEEVASKLIEIINLTADTIAPDGRGFLQAEKTDQEQLAEYLEIRGDVNKWREWINNTESAIVQELLMKGVPQEYIGSIKPRVLAGQYGTSWSAKMEGIISGGP